MEDEKAGVDKRYAGKSRLHQLLMPTEPIDISVGSTDPQCTEIFFAPGPLSWNEQPLPDHYDVQFRACPNWDTVAVRFMTPEDRETFAIANKAERAEMVKATGVVENFPWSSSSWMEPMELREGEPPKESPEDADKPQVAPPKLKTSGHLGAYKPVLLAKDIQQKPHLCLVCNRMRLGLNCERILDPNRVPPHNVTSGYPLILQGKLMFFSPITP